ncbi:hypothetical protein H4R33_002503 [Dimargaris cristalligena]|nr:hypothetical protein H4R33_002503 [Dimargaris cristalligena]
MEEIRHFAKQTTQLPHCQNRWVKVLGSLFLPDYSGPALQAEAQRLAQLAHANDAPNPILNATCSPINPRHHPNQSLSKEDRKKSLDDWLGLGNA